MGKKCGGIFSEEGTAIAVDTSGNTYITGFFSSLNSGTYTCTFNDSVLTSVNGNDIFIAKYNTSGVLEWARSIGGTGDDKGKDIAVDPSGNVYITGSFSSPTIAFDSISLTSSSSYDIFVTKYNAAGHVIWAKSTGGVNNDYSQSIAVDVNGNSYITGYYFSTSFMFGTTTLTNPYFSLGGYKYLVAKYDHLGNAVWAKTVQGSNTMGNGIAVDNAGKTYVTGSFMGPTTFDAIALTNGGGKDMFTAKYDDLGNVLWVKNVGGSNDDVGNGISIDGNKSSYIAGYFKTYSIAVGTTTLINNGIPDGDVMIVKYDSLGVPQWAKKGISYSNDIGLAIAADVGGNSYLTGYFNGSSIIFGGVTLHSSGATTGIGDLLVVKYNSAGVVQWAKNLVSSIGAKGQSIALDAAGNCYLTGFYEDGTLAFNSITLTSAGGRDIFVGKIGNSTSVGISDNINMQGIAVYPNPFYAHTTIQSDAFLHNATLIVDNCFGQTVHQINAISGKTVTLFRNNLPSGLYVMRLIENNKVISVNKLIIVD